MNTAPASAPTSQKFSLADFINLSVAIAVIAMAGHFGMEYLFSDGGSANLRRDVAAVNEAIYFFRISGGDLSHARTPEEVIRLMQSVEKDPLTLKVHSILSSVAANPIFQSPAEAQMRAERAYWDAERMRFEISESGPRGIKAFGRPEKPASTSETHGVTNELHELAEQL
ncbi:MAG: hypothetical protein KDN19_22465 [Verrucomicrobiae bacterium]|nr:hypothetical protein [Verrucomicrobiae bacterium]